MRTLEASADFRPRGHRSRARPGPRGGLLLALLAALAVCGAGCKKDAATEAIETDANGYLCLQCGGKFYTARRVFLESKCPKCGQETLADVVGFVCPKDQHLTIRPKVTGPQGAAVCEQCGEHLKNAMFMPREKDFKTWGATKTTP